MAIVAACRVPCHEVAQTFDVWRQHPDQLVGWFPRGVHATVALRPSSSGSGGGRIETGSSGSGSGAGSSDGSGGDGNGGGNFSGSAGAGAGSRAVCRYGYLSKDSAVLFRGSYSLVLTKGAFLHRDWLSTYTAAVPPQVIAWASCPFMKWDEQALTNIHEFSTLRRPPLCLLGWQLPTAVWDRSTGIFITNSEASTRIV